MSEPIDYLKEAGIIDPELLPPRGITYEEAGRYPKPPHDTPWFILWLLLAVLLMALVIDCINGGI
jgi:hypothetical protein